jgi:hypothetical protein
VPSIQHQTESTNGLFTMTFLDNFFVLGRYVAPMCYGFLTLSIQHGHHRSSPPGRLSRPSFACTLCHVQSGLVSHCWILDRRPMRTRPKVRSLTPHLIAAIIPGHEREVCHWCYCSSPNAEQWLWTVGRRRLFRPTFSSNKSYIRAATLVHRQGSTQLGIF